MSGERVKLYRAVGRNGESIYHWTHSFDEAWSHGDVADIPCHIEEVEVFINDAYVTAWPEEDEE